MNLTKGLTCFVFLLLSCKTYKKNIELTTENNDFIENAINDFSKTKLFKKGTVFNLKIESNIEEYILITIIESKNKFLYSELKKIEDQTIPSKYFELNNKLFLWWDNNFKPDEKNISVLKKYEMLYFSEDKFELLNEYSIDENIKGIDYFFCKNEPSKYKKVITTKTFYKAPKINCD